MPKNTYLYENIMFTNKVRCRIREGERKEPFGAKRKRAGIN